MRIKLIALALAILFVITVVAYYNLNQFVEPEKKPAPSPTPKPALSPTPSPTAPLESTTTITGWGDPHSSYPSKITIISPQNTTYQKNSITLKVNVTTASWVLNSIYFKADWLGGDYHRLFYVGNSPVSAEHSEAITIVANFSGIPDGSHMITVVANYHDSSHVFAAISFTTNSTIHYKGYLF